MDVDGGEEAGDAEGGVEGCRSGEEDTVDVGVAEVDEGALGKAVVGGEEVDAGFEDVEVGGVEGEEDVALESWGRIGVEGGEVEEYAGVAVDDGMACDAREEVGLELVEGVVLDGAGLCVGKVTADVVGQARAIVEGLIV